MAEPHARSLDEIRQLLLELEVSAEDAWGIASTGLEQSSRQNAAHEASDHEFPDRSVTPIPASSFETPGQSRELILPRIVEEQRRIADQTAMSMPPGGRSRLVWPRRLVFLLPMLLLAATSALLLLVHVEQQSAEPLQRLVHGPRPVSRSQAAIAPPPPVAETRELPVVMAPMAPAANVEPTMPAPASTAQAPAIALPAPAPEAAAQPPEPAVARASQPGGPGAAANAETSPPPAKAPAEPEPQPAPDPSPRLVVPTELTAPAGRRSRITLAFEPVSEAVGHDVLITGLEPSAIIDKGVDLIQGTWLVRAVDLGQLELRRAPDAPERLMLRLELRTQSGVVIGESSMLLVAPATAGQPADHAPTGQSTRAAEADLLLREGHALAARGDLANARVFLQQSAELGSADAALALAESFSRAHRTTEVASAAPEDRAQALTWYERAAALGSEEARRRVVGMTRH